jgi:hypothetical protein
MRTAADPVFARAATEGRQVFRTRVELRDGPGLTELTAVVNETEAAVVEVVTERLVLATATMGGAEALERAGFTVDLRGPVDG